MITWPAVNWIAILVATVAAVVVGGLWYAPFLFGKAWQRALGKTDADLKAMQSKAVPGYVLAIVGAIVTGWVLAVTLAWSGATTAMDAVIVAFLAWIGYIVAFQATGSIFEGRSWTLFGINMANALVTLVAMALIIGLWP